MNFLCPACRTPLPRVEADAVVPCACCGVQIDLTRLETAPGTARMWPEVDLTGETLGPWRLVRRIAAGGMGVVYEAEGPEGRCAVKVLAALLAADPSLRERFRREAAALRAIRHPGVVRVLGEGEERGFCYYAMERIEGPDLRERLAKGALPPGEVEGLARRMLDALTVVHAAGFVHRDVKPGNILLAADGPKLCDFGIARLDGKTTLTESAAVLGSLRYMSPEQRLGKAGPQADLYALGVVLHEALAGGVPDEVDLPASAPRRLRKLIGQLTARRATDRPPDAASARVLLDGRRLPRPALAAAALPLLALAGLGLWNGSGAGREEPLLAGEKVQPEAITDSAGLPDAGSTVAQTRFLEPANQKEPLGVNEAPFSVKDPPLGGKERPLGGKERPLGVKEAPLGVKKSPADVKASPLGTKGSPSATKNAPLGMKRKPIGTASGEAPDDGAGSQAGRADSEFEAELSSKKPVRKKTSKASFEPKAEVEAVK